MNPPLDVRGAIDQERQALVDDLANLDDSQWDAQSLCADWKVRDVVGHLVFAGNSDWKDFAVGLVRNKGNLDRVISKAATEIGAAAPSDLERQFAETVGSRNLPPFVKSACELADIVCHGEDIRGQPIGAGMEAVGYQGGRADPTTGTDPDSGGQFVTGEADHRSSRDPSERVDRGRVPHPRDGFRGGHAADTTTTRTTANPAVSSIRP